jgi:hypothetical protein
MLLCGSVSAADSCEPKNSAPHKLSPASFGTNLSPAPTLPLVVTPGLRSATMAARCAASAASQKRGKLAPLLAATDGPSLAWQLTGKTPTFSAIIAATGSNQPTANHLDRFHNSTLTFACPSLSLLCGLIAPPLLRPTIGSALTTTGVWAANFTLASAVSKNTFSQASYRTALPQRRPAVFTTP